MAALTVQTITAAGITPALPVQITAWASGGDTIAATEIGRRGVIAEVDNASGGLLEFRVQDPGKTPAGNPAANGYTAVPVAAGASARVFIGPANVDRVAGTVQVGASSSSAQFTVRLFRY